MTDNNNNIIINNTIVPSDEPFAGEDRCAWRYYISGGGLCGRSRSSHAEDDHPFVAPSRKV